MNKIAIAAELWEIAKPIALVLVSGFATSIAARVNSMLGLKNESELREALHKASERGLEFAAGKLGTTVSQAIADGFSSELVSTAHGYVRSKNPGTLKKLKIGDGALTDILISKIGKGS